MNPAQSRGTRKALRDLFQAVVATVGAGGAFALMEVAVGTVSPVWGVALAFVFKVMVAYAQNYLETKGSIGVMLPTPGLVTKTEGGPVGQAVGTVDAVTTGTGEVVGRVLDTTGDVVGNVTGTVGGLLGEQG